MGLKTGFAQLGRVGWAIFLVIGASTSILTPLDCLAARVVLSCGSMGKELEVCRSSAEAWAKKTGNKVKVIASPSDAGERLAQYQLLLAAGGSDIDVFLIDTTWPGMLGNFFVDLNQDAAARAQSSKLFPSFVKNNTVDGKLVAMPWFIDAGVLYYRSDLLKKYGEKVPTTWKELSQTAYRIQQKERAHGNPRFWGFVFQARAYEGLTCDALEWIASSGGGTIVDDAGHVTVNNPKAAQALRLAASWINGPHAISPRGVLDYMEEESRGVFQSGNAAFMRNWPYAMKLANAPDSPVKGKVGMTVLPMGTEPGSRHLGALGGWSLAVSKYSHSRAAAISLVTWLTRPEEQKHRALVLGENPTVPALYHDPTLIKDNPELPVLLKVFQNAVPRPSGPTGPKYNRVSSEFWDAVHRVLSGETTAPKALQKLWKRLEFISRKEKW